MREIVKDIFHWDTGTANVYLIKARHGLVIIDCSVKGTLFKLERVLKNHNYRLQDIKQILITHAHVDHVGGLAEIQAASGAEVWVHSLEAPIVQGEKPVPMVKKEALSLADRLIGSLIIAFVGKEQAAATVQRRLTDNEALDEIYPGLKLLHLPGHSPGHSGFWFENEKLLIGGDLMMHLTPWLTRPLAVFTPDMALNVQGIARVLRLKPQILALGHGAVIKKEASKAIERLLTRLERSKLALSKALK